MNIWKTTAAFILGFLALGAAAEAQPAELASGQLLLTGSSTMAPLVTAIAKRFQTLHPGVRVEVQMGGSGRGIADARQGKADIGMASRALTEKERDLQGFPIARDGVALVVHKTNPVPSLTDRQVVEIYSGKITNWKQLGGHDAPILVVKAEPTRSSTELFTHYFGLRYEDLKAQREVGDNPARIKLLIENPNALLYMSVGEAERKAQVGVPIKLMPVGGVAATSKNIRNGNFPISRPLTLVTRELPKGLARTFIEFALSSQVTDLVLTHDFVPYLD
jgi:phosphate transport system substrate-binding protein